MVASIKKASLIDWNAVAPERLICFYPNAFPELQPTLPYAGDEAVASP